MTSGPSHVGHGGKSLLHDPLFNNLSASPRRVVATPAFDMNVAAMGATVGAPAGRRSTVPDLDDLLCGVEGGITRDSPRDDPDE